MPIVFLFVGVLLIVSAINNKLPELKRLVGEDFAPTDNSVGFHIWIVALFVAGSLGYVKAFRPVANAFIALILVSLILSNRGFFANFQKAINGE